MNEKLTDKNIDLTFKEAIDQMETEPSEKFWTEASDSILEGANKSFSRKVRIWKMTSLALAAMLVCLVFYTSYTGNKINSIQKQLTSLEKQQVSDKNKDEINEKNGTISPKSGNVQANGIVKSNNGLANNVNTLLNQNTVQKGADKNSDRLTTKLSSSTPVKANGNDIIASGNESEAKPNTQSISDIKGSNTTSASLTSPQSIATNETSLPASAQEISANGDLSLSSQLEPIESKTVSGISFAAAGDSKINATNSSLVKSLVSASNPVSRSARYSIGIFIAPSATGEFNNSANGNLYSNSATGGEKARMAFDAGVNVDYALSHKWTVESGLGYHTYSFSMKPTLIWAKPATQGQLVYSIVTSCGILQLPYQDIDLKPGDKVNANGNAYCGYLSIPLQIKYNLVTGKHLGLYVTGGAIANLTIVKGAFIHWENTTDQDNASIQNIQGLRSSQYSLTVGAGIRYFLGKGFSIYGEPFMNGSATPIDKNVPVVSYPYFIGMRAGLFYNL